MARFSVFTATRVPSPMGCDLDSLGSQCNRGAPEKGGISKPGASEVPQAGDIMILCPVRAEGMAYDGRAFPSAPSSWSFASATPAPAGGPRGLSLRRPQDPSIATHCAPEPDWELPGAARGSLPEMQPAICSQGLPVGVNIGIRIEDDLVSH